MYAELIDQKISHVYQKGVAAKILQGMDRIRNEFDETQARRWPTELLQNARDLSEPGQPVRVLIKLTGDTVHFQHSGRPFSVQDILSIVNQISSKKPGEGIGQFGTGFMSTFQLSMQVDIRSFLKDGQEPYRPFHVCLDRSGTTQEEISDAIEKAIHSLKTADTAPPLESLESGALNTEFCYHLRDGRSRKIAWLGIEDLRRTLPCIMLFSQQLSEVKLIIRTKDRSETLTFRRGGTEELSGGLLRQKILVGTRRKAYITFRQDDITLAAEWNRTAGFLSVPAGAPRLYVDFPLIGSEQFPFPVVLNSTALRPNEPRSSVSLIGSADSLDAQENQSLLDRAAGMYQEFLSALLTLDRRGIEHVMSIPPQEERKEWSAAWVRGHLYERIYNFLSRQPLLPVNGKYHALAEKGVRLVQAETAEQREQLAALWRKIPGMLLPEDGTDWYAVLSGYLPPTEKCVTVRSALEAAPGQIAKGLRTGVKPAEWLAALYDLGMEAKETAILTGEAALFPNQNAEDLAAGRLHTAREIFTDPGIPELLKDASEKLDGLEPANRLELRKQLLHQEFRPETALFLPAYTLAGLADYIITRSDRGFRVRGYAQRSDFYNEAWAAAWSLLLAAGPDRELYRLCRTGWRDLPEYTGKSPLFDDRMWSNACRGVLNLLLAQVGKAGSMDVWAQTLNSRTPKTNTVLWLAQLYAKAAQYLRVSELFNTPVLPNQYGIFRTPSDLRLDQTGDEELKKISVCFKAERPECDVPAVLLDQRLQLPGWNLPALGPEEVASHINAFLQPFLAHMNLSQAAPEIQEACTRLLGWIQDHPKQAERCFPAFCGEEDQMKLLTLKAAVNLRKKADCLNKLLTLAGTENPESLLQFVQDQGFGLPKTAFDPESGVVFDGDWKDLDSSARKDRLRQIGEAGERCAFRAVAEYFAGLGFRTEQADAQTIHMTGPDGTAVIYRPDTEDYHQPGWDIQVQTKAGAEKHTYFLEVKTHTLRSRNRAFLPLSDTQMQKAAQLGEAYILLLVIYNEKLNRAEKLVPFRNITGQIAAGSLRSAEGRYMLKWEA